MIFHQHKWAEPKNRYQMCLVCGIVRTTECAHQWKTIQTIQGEYIYGGGQAYRYIQQCQICGEIHRVDIV